MTLSCCPSPFKLDMLEHKGVAMKRMKRLITIQGSGLLLVLMPRQKLK